MNVKQVLPPDAIPSVDAPEFGHGYTGDDDDMVLAVELTKVVRGYPIRYLNYHEIVNDRIGGEPIAVTWCPLCGSGIVYERKVEGKTLEFGVSGKLADDDLVMYDRETESEWKQSTGWCIGGELEGNSLAVKPAQLVSWSVFRERYPNGLVLQPPGGESEAASDSDTPAQIDYDDRPYRSYFEMDGFGLGAHRGDQSRKWNRDDNISPKTVVLGIEIEDSALGFPLSRVLDAGGIVQETVGGKDVVVVATEDLGIHGYYNPGYLFNRSGEEFRADGTTWDPVTGKAEDGRVLERVPARRLFAFTWQDDHGPTAFYEP